MALNDEWKSENRAAEVLRQLQITSLPVDPFQIATQRDIVVQEDTSLSAGISGCLMKVGDVFGIIYSSRFSSEGFKRFTVAHELGHYFMEGHAQQLFPTGGGVHKSESGFVSKDSHEREADAFAASLLMPKQLFKGAIAKAGNGLEAIEFLSDLCGTSLTATAIRYAKLCEDDVAVVCSTGSRIDFAFMSNSLRARPNLTWIRKGTGLTSNCPTARFNTNPDNIRYGRRISDTADLGDWFTGGDGEVTEEIVGLGEYGRTLTILSIDEYDACPDRDEEPEDADEMLLPSQRFYRKTSYD